MSRAKHGKITVMREVTPVERVGEARVNSWKYQFREEHGFLPYQHACLHCGGRQGDHAAWKVDRECTRFVPTDPPEQAFFVRKPWVNRRRQR